MKQARAFILVAALAGLLTPLFSAGSRGVPERRDYRGDLRVQAGRELSADEIELAEYAILFYYVKFGYASGSEGLSLRAAVEGMNDEDYGYAIDKASRFCVSAAAKAVLKTGKTGEKALKALIVTAEKAWEAGQRWIDEGAKAYDETH